MGWNIDVPSPIGFFGSTRHSFTCGPLTSRRRGTNPSEGSRGNSRVAPTTDSLAGAPIAPASPSPERGERSPSQEWQQQLASSWFSPSGWNESQLCGVGLFQGYSAPLHRREASDELSALHSINRH